MRLTRDKQGAADAPARKRSSRSSGTVSTQSVDFERAVVRVMDVVNSKQRHSRLVVVESAESVGGGMHHLTPISVGDNEGNRTGNTVRVRTLRIKLVKRESIDTADGNWLRLMVLYSTGPNGFVPTISNIIDTAIGDALVPFAPRQVAHLGEFRTLRDWVVWCPPRTSGFAGGNPVQESIDFFMKIPDEMSEITYNGTATIPITGGFWVLAISDQTVLSQKFAFVSRVTFDP